MDPNQTLADIQSILAYEESNPLTQDHYDELADRIRALDSWLSNGGFLPAAWRASTRYPTN